MNALEALKVYFPNTEGPVGPYGLLVGLAYLEENPATEPHRREVLMALIDSIAPLAETLTDEQLERLTNVIVGFFKLGATLVVPHVVDKKKEEQVFRRSLGPLNAAKATAQDCARTLASEIWQADADQEYRLKDMAGLVEDVLKRKGCKELPSLERIKEWIKPVAPAYARKGGRPRKTP
jgi:tRNA nucleotidyltransferase/poly(A) polymerase